MLKRLLHLCVHYIIFSEKKLYKTLNLSNFLLTRRIIDFILLSNLLENALIGNMYVKLNGEAVSSNNGIEISDVEGKASNINGFMKFKVKNKSNDYVFKKGSF